MFNLFFLPLLLMPFWQIGLKPVHHDESINGWFVTQMWQNGFFQYDPTNYHGPLLFYLFQISEALFGWGVGSFRLVTVGFTVLTILLLKRWGERSFGLSNWWLVALCLSPGVVFFGRSGIHEAPFVFFTTLAVLSGYRLWTSFDQKAVFGLLIGITGALLLKETFVIPLAVGGLVLFAQAFFARQRSWVLLRSVVFDWTVFLCFVLCLLTWALFMSGFGRHPSGLADFFVALLPWAKTGLEAGGHAKPFSYFLELIWKFEKATVGALVLCGGGLLMKVPVRNLCLWALGVLLVYSLIPYKTPWCLLSIQLPIWIAAGAVLGTLQGYTRRGAQLGLMILALFNVSLWMDLNFERPTQAHPYVYVQTTKDTQRFVNEIYRQSESRPELRSAILVWASQEPWPFPWMFAAFSKQTSQAFNLENAFVGDLVVVDKKDQEAVQSVLPGPYLRAEFFVRDSREPAVVFLRKGLFECPFDHCLEVGP